MKRFFSFLLIFTLVFSFSVPVFATDYRAVADEMALDFFDGKGYLDTSSSIYGEYSSDYGVYYNDYILTCDTEWHNSNGYVYVVNYCLYIVNGDYNYSLSQGDSLNYSKYNLDCWSGGGYSVYFRFDGSDWETYNFHGWSVGTARTVTQDEVIASSFDIFFDDGSFFFKVPAVPTLPLLEQVTTIQTQGGQMIQADLTDYLTTLVPYGICLMALLLGLVVLLRVLRTFLV